MTEKVPPEGPGDDDDDGRGFHDPHDPEADGSAFDDLDGDAQLTRAKIVDPSWFNWPALPVAMADTIVPDFPLTNKSFNLSYAGNDL